MFKIFKIMIAISSFSNKILKSDEFGEGKLNLNIPHL